MGDEHLMGKKTELLIPAQLSYPYPFTYLFAFIDVISAAVASVPPAQVRLYHCRWCWVSGCSLLIIVSSALVDIQVTQLVPLYIISHDNHNTLGQYSWVGSRVYMVKGS